MAGAVSLWRREAVFLTAMLAGETSIVGLSTLFKVATSKGLNIYPFLSYSYLLASLLLLPSLFFTNRSRSLPPLSASILSKIGLLGFLGMEKVSFKERSSVAKVMGTILSLIGAFVVIFYHGPRVFVASSPPYLNFRQLSPPLSSSKSDWLIGGAILTIQGIFVSVSFILQGIITSVYYVIHSWAIRHKRPLYLAIFKPLSILIAVVMGTIFLNDSLYLGCLIGGILITLGFYVVMWGKANEEKNKLLSFSGKEKTPLLLSGKNDQI